MPGPFEKYAQYYDLIYQDKDYKRECDFIEEAIRRYSSRKVKTLLEVGSGTGGHAIPLIERGYKVTGIDRSPTMMEQASRKAKAANVQFSIHEADARHFDLKQRFDACICMFSVLGYLPETRDIQEALSTIKRHLKPNGLFIFDVWNGLAVLRILPEVRVKVMEDGKRRLTRTVEPELDAFRHICWTTYRVIVTEKNRVVDEIEERHFSRFLFPQEIKHYLEEAGFEVLSICPFLELDGKVDETVWNMAVVARATEGG